MRNKLTKIVIVILVIALVICLVPVRIVYRDGGSVEYKAIAYSITRYNRLDPQDEAQRLNGWRIEILGFVFRDVF